MTRKGSCGRACRCVSTAELLPRAAKHVHATTSTSDLQAEVQVTQTQQPVGVAHGPRDAARARARRSRVVPCARASHSSPLIHRTSPHRPGAPCHQLRRLNVSRPPPLTGSTTRLCPACPPARARLASSPQPLPVTPFPSDVCLAATAPIVLHVHEHVHVHVRPTPPTAAAAPPGGVRLHAPATRGRRRQQAHFLATLHAGAASSTAMRLAESLSAYLQRTHATQRLERGARSAARARWDRSLVCVGSGSAAPHFSMKTFIVVVMASRREVVGSQPSCCLTRRIEGMRRSESSYLVREGGRR